MTKIVLLSVALVLFSGCTSSKEVNTKTLKDVTPQQIKRADPIAVMVIRDKNGTVMDENSTFKRGERYEFDCLDSKVDGNSSKISCSWSGTSYRRDGEPYIKGCFSDNHRGYHGDANATKTHLILCKSHESLKSFDINLSVKDEFGNEATVGNHFNKFEERDLRNNDLKPQVIKKKCKSKI